MSPLVSVIIPTYNNADVVAAAVESALLQRYEPKEIIVVDDGSSDNTPATLARFAGRIKVVQQANSGPGAARNNGVNASHGELIAFLDADDLWLPGKLERQVKLLCNRPDVGAAYHDWYVAELHRSDSRFLPQRLAHQEQIPEDREHRYDVGWLYNELLLESVLCTDTVMLRKALFEELGGFDQNLPQGQDYDFWLRVSRVTQIGKLREKLAVVRIRQESITTTPRKRNYRALILQRALDKWGRTGPDGRVTDRWVIRKVLGNIWFDYGCGHLKSGDAKVARQALLRSIGFRPMNARAWYNFLRSYV